MEYNFSVKKISRFLSLKPCLKITVHNFKPLKTYFSSHQKCSILFETTWLRSIYDLFWYRQLCSVKQFYILRMTKIEVQMFTSLIKKLDDRLNASHCRLEIYFKMLNQSAQILRKCFCNWHNSFTIQRKHQNK